MVVRVGKLQSVEVLLVELSDNVADVWVRIKKGKKGYRKGVSRHIASGTYATHCTTHKHKHLVSMFS
jgi:hypothetical protein